MHLPKTMHYSDGAARAQDQLLAGAGDMVE